MFVVVSSSKKCVDISVLSKGVVISLNVSVFTFVSVNVVFSKSV